MNYKRVLVLAPHTDDAELGAGGTIARLVEEGSEVFVVAFSTAVDSRPPGTPEDVLKKEFFQALPTLGVKASNLIAYEYPVRRLSYHRQEVLEELVVLRRRIEPDLVLLPSGQDVHQDHQVIHAEGLRACRNQTLLGYELPWNHITFSAQAFVVLHRRHVEMKWQAMQAYRSQFELERPYFSQEFIDGLARVRGTQVNVEWAEAFEVLRIKM
ncbi:MAG: PIG-L family deacetylase [Chloroflexi bacterium]|nr:PIG-L family deacetylase [Chloroflexota bacterium]